MVRKKSGKSQGVLFPTKSGHPQKGTTCDFMISSKMCLILKEFSTEGENSFCQELILINPIALRKTKIVYNFGLSECNRVKKGDIKKNKENHFPSI